MNGVRRALIGLVFVLGACGASPARTVPAPSVPHPSPDTYLAAAAAGARSECLGRALVDGVGVRRLRAAGVTPADLRSTVYALPATIGRSMARAQRLAFGARLQACGFCDGELAAPEHRLLAADLVLFTQPPTAAEAREFATIRCAPGGAFSLRP